MVAISSLLSNNTDFSVLYEVEFKLEESKTLFFLEFEVSIIPKLSLVSAELDMFLRDAQVTGDGSSDPEVLSFTPNDRQDQELQM